MRWQFLAQKQGANALSQRGVFMEELPECLTDSVDLGTEGCSVNGEGFEPCLSLKLHVREYILELSDSVSNLSLHFSVVCFRKFSVLPGEALPTSDFRSSILVSFARLFANSSLTPVIAFSSPASSLLAWVTHNWLIIKHRQGALNFFCALTCTVGYAGKVLY